MHQTMKIRRNGLSLCIKEFSRINLLPKLGEDGVKWLKAYEDKFASQLQNVKSCKNIYLKL